MVYKNYLQTEHWKKKRKEKLLKNPICQICEFEKGLHIHHKFYIGKDQKSLLFRETVENLVTLCSSCHRLFHHYFGIRVPKLNKKILRIKRLLNLNVPKKRAFYFVSQDKLYIRVRNYLTL